MARVRVRLFANFSITDENQSAAEFPTGKLRDVFCYLLVNHDRNLPRELIASALWENGTTVQSKKYLRTGLWQLRKILDASFGAGDALEVDPLYARLNTGLQVWLDVAELEHVYDSAARTTGGSLDDGILDSVKTAVALYSGDLLPGNYYEWCLHERVRLQEMYLALLDKLLAHYEAQCDCDAVRSYGSLLLRYNPFSEHIYQRLMRAYNSAGDRGAALALYQQCESTLQEHLGVHPSAATSALYKQIRSGTLGAPGASRSPADLQAPVRQPLFLPQARQIHDAGTGKTSSLGPGPAKGGTQARQKIG